MPDHMKSGLGEVEYTNVIASMSSLADPQLPMKRKSQGKYFEYTDEDRAKIGKYACEHGNKKARRHFLGKIPKLSESSVRNFKKPMKRSWEKTRRKITHSQF